MARSSTTYPRKWKSRKTTVVRIPERIADDILRIARRLDEMPKYKLREEAAELVLEFHPARRITYNSNEPVNVASVPQRSPFRYPGGKTWLVPYIRDWLQSKRTPPKRLIEPFAGGAIVSLTAAFEGLARHAIFAELDPAVASVWRVVLNGQAEWLARKILNFDLTLENVALALNTDTAEFREKAFQTILRNRVQRGGILADGAGLIKTGEGGRGLASRWYPETLASRIRQINLQKDRMTFIEGDGLHLIQEHKEDADSVFYIDPPYTIAARRLYKVWHIDHAKLFANMAACRGDFLMSYDNTVEIQALAEKHGLQSRAIAMKSSHHAKMTELLISKDLSWLGE
ncbi:MAG TPA: DNA adenine methylase [Verrucomicrobiae bacterium]|jgi:DNA adenine methylase|nr:DNA adenine methylase [Verrucomicrobiae bacterium]